MDGDNNDRKKGFAGLDSMVSDVEAPISPPSDPVHKDKVAPLPAPDAARPKPPYSIGNPSSGSSSGKWWAIGAGLFVFIIWINGSGHNTAPAAPGQDVAASASAAVYPSGTQVQTNEPTTTSASNNEELPPIGSGEVLSSNQIRYCLSESIRIESMRMAVNIYSQYEVDQLNAAVGDYNRRCSNYRFRIVDMETVRGQVEEKRSLLMTEGQNKVIRLRPATTVYAPPAQDYTPPASSNAPSVSTYTPGIPSDTPTIPTSVQSTQSDNGQADQTIDQSEPNRSSEDMRRNAERYQAAHQVCGEQPSDLTQLSAYFACMKSEGLSLLQK